MKTTNRARAVKKAVDDLAELSPDEIAILLKARGIKGEPGHAVACPIAKYLAPRTRIGYVSVSQSLIYVHHKDGKSPHLLRIKTPDSIARFVNTFDAGYYPELNSVPDEVPL